MFIIKPLKPRTLICSLSSTHSHSSSSFSSSSSLSYSYSLSSSSHHNSSMANTQPVTDAAFAVKSQEEMIICRNLANSILDGSRYAWKLLYSGEVENCRSKKSMWALEKVRKTAEKEEEKKLAQKKLFFNSPTSKSYIPKPRSRVYARRSEGKGVKIVEPNSEDREKIRANPINRLPIVCALMTVGLTERTAPQRKGKGKMHKVKMEVESEEEEKQGVDSEVMCGWETEFAEGGTYHDLFIEDEDGTMRHFKIYEDYERELR